MRISKDELVQNFHQETEIGNKKIKDSLETEKDYDCINFDDLGNTKHSKEKAEPIVYTPKRGRPKGSTKIREKIACEKLTIVLKQYQKELLVKKAKQDNRSTSDYIKNTLREIKNIKKAIIKDEENNPNNKSVSITISISKKEINELKAYAKKLNRNVSDSIRYSLKYPSKIKQQILKKY